MSIKYRELKRRYDLDGPRRTTAHLSAALAAGHLRPEDFSLRDLAEALVPDGGEWVRTLDPRSASGAPLLEAGDGVDTTAFLNITGQVIYNRILEAYAQEAFVASKLVQTIPTRFDGEKLPGVARLADEVPEVRPGMPYPHLGFGEDYIETPATTKRGFIVPVTKEAVFFDRTYLVLQRAAEVGEVLGLNKEKRLLDLIVGSTNNYKWRGTNYDTYQASAPWVNVKSGNELVDWTSVDSSEQLFAEMLDPHTGEPILIDARTVLVTPAYQHAAARIFNATDVQTVDNRAAAQTVRTSYANPLTGYSFAASRLLYRRIVASGVSEVHARQWWFHGDFSRAFAYMENWPITVTQAPQNSEAEFNQDVVARYKASERGAAAVLNPRYVVKNFVA